MHAVAAASFFISSELAMTLKLARTCSIGDVTVRLKPEMVFDRA